MCKSSIVKMFSVAVVLSVVMSAQHSEARKRYYKKIEVKEALRVELNGVLKAASSLHQACFDRKEPAIEATMKDLVVRLRRAQGKANLAPGQRTHLMKMLTAAQESLEVGRRQTGEARQKSLSETFRQLVQLVRVFKVDKYQVFFCSKDKNVWLQKGWKAKNPFHPVRYKHCGKLG